MTAPDGHDGAIVSLAVEVRPCTCGWAETPRASFKQSPASQFF